MRKTMNASPLPGSGGGFTMAVWRAEDVPVGSEVGIVAAPSAANGAEMPELPTFTWANENGALFDSAAMKAYARAAVLAERAALDRIFSEILIDSQTSDEAQHKLDSAIRART